MFTKTFCFIFVNSVLPCKITYSLRTIITVVEEESLPFDFPHFNEGKYHYPFYAFEVLSLYISAYDNMAVDLITVSAISLIVVQLRILNRKLIDTELNVRNSPDFMEKNIEDDVLRYVEECCQHYCDIEKYVFLFCYNL